jgi:hypothetical protein
MLVLNGSTVQVVNALTGALATVSYQDESGASISAPSYLTASDPRKSFKCLTVGDYTFVANREVTVGSSTITTSYGTTNFYKAAADVPATPASGTLYIVTGTSVDGSGRYYLKQSTLSSSVYTETCAASVTAPNKADLPWTLVKTGATTFVLRRGNYLPPQVGDDASNFPASFIGRQIRDVFFYRGRLGFLTSSSVLMSQPITNINAALGIQYNFYRKSMTVVAADDPIDATVAHPRAPTLSAAALFNKTLLVFGDTVQFQCQPQGDVLSPATFALNPVTEFDCSQTVRPVGLGPKVYFTQPSSGGMRLREFFVQKLGVIQDAIDVTLQCPTYVSPNVFTMATSTTENLLALANTAYTPLYGTQDVSPASYLYIYRPQFDGEGNRTQSNWSRYTFPANDSDAIIGMGVSQSVMYLLWYRTTGIYLETLDWVTPAAAFVTRGDVPFADGIVNTQPSWICLDRVSSFASGTGTYSNTTGYTTWTGAWDTTNYTSLNGVVTSVSPGETVAIEVVNATTIRAFGDYSAKAIAIGVPVTMSVMLSRIQLRGRDDTPDIGAVLRLRSLQVNTRDSGPITVAATQYNQFPHGATMAERVLGSTVLSAGKVFTGSSRLSINAQAAESRITIQNATPIRATISGLTWEGEITRRTKRA